MGPFAGAWLAGCSFILPARGASYRKIRGHLPRQSIIMRTSGSIIILVGILVVAAWGVIYGPVIRRNLSKRVKVPRVGLSLSFRSHALIAFGWRHFTSSLSFLWVALQAGQGHSGLESVHDSSLGIHCIAGFLLARSDLTWLVTCQPEQ